MGRIAGIPLSVVISLALSMPLAVPLAHAESSEVEALRARVNELEGLLLQVVDRLEAAELGESRQQLLEQDKRLQLVEEEVTASGDRWEQFDEQVLEISRFFETEPTIGFNIGKSRIGFGGYLKAQTLVSSYSDGAPPSSSVGRDFAIPSAITVDPSGDRETVLDFNPRETRFLFTANTPVAGHDLKAHIELDFLVTFNDNELVSNSFTPRMRQAFLTYRGLLAGQAWSTFQDVSALPETVQFIGPTEGTVFNRQPMIRYTSGPFEVAVENPETTITTPNGGRFIPDNDILPDFTARYTHRTGNGTLKLAGIARQLRVRKGTMIPGLDDPLQDDQTALGLGLSLTGKLAVGERDDLRFSANVGEGLGRYMGVALTNGASIDENGELDPLFMYSGFAAYRHFWNQRFRSTFAAGYFRADHPVEQTGFGVTDRVYSASANLLYSPNTQLTFGLEYYYGQRRLESGDDGDLNRMLLSAKYGF
jgi:hypothetical protein